MSGMRQESPPHHRFGQAPALLAGRTDKTVAPLHAQLIGGRAQPLCQVGGHVVLLYTAIDVRQYKWYDEWEPDCHLVMLGQGQAVARTG